MSDKQLCPAVIGWGDGDERSGNECNSQVVAAWARKSRATFKSKMRMPLFSLLLVVLFE